MGAEKKNVRRNFRLAVFERARYQCELCLVFGRDRQGGDEHSKYHSAGHGCCGDQIAELDAHHITPREMMPRGGYIAENGISVCEDCHRKCERYLNEPIWEGVDPIDGLFDDFEAKFGPEHLYKVIGSSLTI